MAWKTAERDIDIYRGGQVPVKVRLRKAGGPFVIGAEDEMVLTIFTRQKIRKTSADGGLVLDRTGGVITYTPTVEESLQVPRGRMVKFELEHRKPGGYVKPYLTGYVIGHGGMGA